MGQVVQQSSAAPGKPGAKPPLTVSTVDIQQYLTFLLGGEMYAVGILAPLALVPQILQIYTTKSSAGISLFTWLLLALVNALWALYGAVHKDAQLIFANAFITLFDLVIVVGILMYPAFL